MITFRVARGQKHVEKLVGIYAGLKHSICSQYINEKGLSIDELQMITNYARRDSVLKYVAVQVEAKQRLMGRKVIEFPGGQIGDKPYLKNWFL